MAEEVQENQTEEIQTEEKPKKKKIFMILGGIVLLVLVAQTAIIISMFLGSKSSTDESPAEQEAAQVEEEEEIPTEKFLLDEFMVNLKSTGTADHYVRATIYLKYEINEDEDLATVLEEKKIDIESEIIKHLRKKTLNDMRSIDSVEVLSTEIKDIVNEVLKTESITEVLFSNIVYN